MTLSERAVRIHDALGNLQRYRQTNIEHIESELKAAVEDYWKARVKEACEESAYEALEKAAQVAEQEPCTHCDICPKLIGRLIRALKASP